MSLQYFGIVFTKKEGKFLSKSQKIRDQQYYLDRYVILQTKQRQPQQVEPQGVLKWIREESKSIHTFPQSKNEKIQLIYFSRKRNGRSIQKIRKATEQINQVSLFLRIQQYIYSNKTNNYYAIEKGYGYGWDQNLNRKKIQNDYITWISRLLPLIRIERNNIREHKPSLTEHDFKELTPEGT